MYVQEKIDNSFNETLKRVRQENIFTDSDIKTLLLSEGEAQQKLFEVAREARRENFGNMMKIRGVIEISNSCVKNCDYCAMRAGNSELDRYSLEPDVIVKTAGDIVSLGIKTVFLQGGQNPKTDKTLEAVIPRIAEMYGCEILLCVGEKSAETYIRYKDLGATSYILKFEASTPELYGRIAHSEQGERVRCLSLIRDAGMRVGTGNIIGLPGQTLDDIISDIKFAAAFSPEFVSASPFIPNKGTPFENEPKGGINLTLNTMAIWRIMLPAALIPTVSALEYIHPDGQVSGLNAGANVITVNFTPKTNRDKYAIYADDRFVVSLKHASDTAEKAGLTLDLSDNA